MRKNDMQDEEIIEEAVVEEPEKDEVSEELQRLETQYKRALADYQNLEKRVSEQRREWVTSANKDLLMRLMPVLDTLMMASQHTEDQAVKITIDQFLSALKQEGVERIETEGKDFDPLTMEAIGTVEGKDGKVVQEARAGFMLYEKVLRPAQVIVGKES